MVRKTATQNREHVLAIASDLYYQHGVRAVGMDLIVQRSGVGNATVYRQFPSKDDLAAAYVQRSADAWFARMHELVDPIKNPRTQLIAIFDAVQNDILRPTFRGCPMLNTNTEFPDPQHPAHAVAVTHKNDVRTWFRDLSQRAGATKADDLADDLTLLLNGAYATAAVLGPTGPANRSANLAKRLITLYCKR